MTKPLRLAVIGLSLSSSWGNGHATTYRALLKAMARRGHDIIFLERDQPWYARHRDLTDPPYCDLRFYDDLPGLAAYRNVIAGADVVIVGSYIADGVATARWVRDLRDGVTSFYDIDTPVTLADMERGVCEYLSPDLIPSFDLYLSFTGGPLLKTIERRYGSPAARPLYCAVDEELYRPLDAEPEFDLGYLGTYSPDRQPALERLLIEPARRAPKKSFVVAGPQYPASIAWPDNVRRLDHVGPADHAAFYASCRHTLNVTRADMKRAGYSPSVRLFEAAACGTPIISDEWAGLDSFFAAGAEIALAENAEDVLAALAVSDDARRTMGAGARARVLASHVADRRAAELDAYLIEAMARRPRVAPRAVAGA